MYRIIESEILPHLYTKKNYVQEIEAVYRKNESGKVFWGEKFFEIMDRIIKSGIIFCDYPKENQYKLKDELVK